MWSVKTSVRMLCSGVILERCCDMASSRRAPLRPCDVLDAAARQPRILYAVLVLLAANPALTGYSNEQRVREAQQGMDGPPWFDPAYATDVGAFVGQTVLLPCVIHNLGDKLVSWIRSRDLNILTHGEAAFTGDSRVGVLRDDAAWSLRVTAARHDDSGKYECQINTDPKMSLFFTLTVTDPPLEDVSVMTGGLKASISGPRDQHASSGATVTFVCVVTCEELCSNAKTVNIPPIQWLHNNLAVSFQSERGGILVDSERGARGARSRLTLADARARDAGRYTCSTPHARPDTVVLHIDEGEHMEAMQRDQATSSVSCCFTIGHRSALFILAAIVWWLAS